VVVTAAEVLFIAALLVEPLVLPEDGVEPPPPHAEREKSPATTSANPNLVT